MDIHLYQCLWTLISTLSNSSTTWPQDEKALSSDDMPVYFNICVAITSEAHRDPRKPRIVSISTDFLPNLCTQDPSVPFRIQFRSILMSLCGDKDFFLRCHRLVITRTPTADWRLRDTNPGLDGTCSYCKISHCFIAPLRENTRLERPCKLALIAQRIWKFRASFTYSYWLPSALTALHSFSGKVVEVA